MSKSNIEWTEQTWNPIVGCSIVSPGCTNCYAMKTAARNEAMGIARYDGTTRVVNGNSVWTGKLAQAPDATLLQPLKRRKPTTWFVNSMGDLFHEDVPDEWIDRVFAVMVLCPQHTFQVLTKRAARMREYLTDPLRHNTIELAAETIVRGPEQWAGKHVLPQLPLKNVWLGVSTERQQEADERLPLLLQTPAAVRFISAEPLLGPIVLSPYVRNGRRSERPWSDFMWPDWVPEKTRQEVESFWRKDWGRGPSAWLRSSIENGHPPLGTFGKWGLLRAGEPLVEGRFVHAWNNIGRVIDADGSSHCVSAGSWQVPNPYLDWVIVGGESGPGARPMHPDWARSLRDQCQAAGVPFFFKQWGEWEWFYDRDKNDPDWRNVPHCDNQMGRGATRFHNLAGGIGFHGDRLVAMRNVGKARAGRLLDGVEHNAMPEVAR